MSLSFLLDEDISYRVAEALRQRGVDAVSVYELGRGNRRIPDDEQLTFAADQGHVLVTYNRADYQALDAQWRVQGRRQCGITWCSERSVPRRNIGQLVRALEAMAQEHESLAGLCLPLSRAPLTEA